MITNAFKGDRFFFWLYQFINANQGWLITLLSGFLLGRFTNEFSVPNTGYRKVINGVFSIDDRPANLMSWVSLILLIILPISSRILMKIHIRRRYESIFASLVKLHKAPAITPYDNVGWDHALSLQNCPELSHGWLMSEVRLHHDTTEFTLPVKYNERYQNYFQKYYQDKRFFDNGVKFMLTRNPIAFSDSPTLELHTQKTVYSHVKFFHENIAKDTPERNALIHALVENSKVDFLHTLCMHLIVITSAL